MTAPSGIANMQAIVGTADPARIFVVAVALRLLFIVVGVVLDSCSGIPSYTDIDYYVFTDAARLAWNGVSPFERSTYRYPPLLAWILTPTVWFPWFGKVLFAIADAACCLELLYSGAALGHERAQLYAWLWVFNLPSINICTRGSSDAITNYLVLYLVRKVMKLKTIGPRHNQLVSLGVLFGLLVYLRIYPIIYASAILWHITSNVRSKNEDLSFAVFHVGIKFSVAATSTFYLLCWVSYCFYGNSYVENALLYHLTREDHRHSFSVHFLGSYLSHSARQTYVESLLNWMQRHSSFFGVIAALVQATDSSIATAVVKLVTALMSKLLLFLPQLVLFVLIVAKFATGNLPVCLLLQTMVFVAYNKVITAQYFVWYLCLVPLAMPSLQFIPWRWAGTVLIAWVASLTWWLLQAYQLEFLGQDRLVAVWLASLWFHAANVLVIAVIVMYTPRTAPAPAIDTGTIHSVLHN